MKTEKMKILEKALERKMPFGKYKGETLEEIPDSYLEWISAQDNVNDSLCIDIGFVLTWRKEIGSHIY